MHHDRNSISLFDVLAKRLDVSAQSLLEKKLNSELTRLCFSSYVLMICKALDFTSTLFSFQNFFQGLLFRCRWVWEWVNVFDNVIGVKSRPNDLKRQESVLNFKTELSSSLLLLWFVMGYVGLCSRSHRKVDGI